MSGTALRLSGVSLRVDDRLLFPPLDLLAAPGQTVTVMGASGSGKSTLLSFVAGTLNPAVSAAGAVWLGGSDVTALPPEQRRIGILFQDDLLFPHMSVGDNMGFGIPRAVPRAERQRRVAAALAEAGLEGFAERDPATLSGGQKMRVACLRVLLSEPRALLLDEPFSALDAALRGRFRHFVFERLRQRNLPALLVSHDPGDARAAGGPVITLSREKAVSGN